MDRERDDVYAIARYSPLPDKREPGDEAVRAIPAKDLNNT
jgi:hypothetical protein